MFIRTALLALTVGLFAHPVQADMPVLQLADACQGWKDRYARVRQEASAYKRRYETLRARGNNAQACSDGSSTLASSSGGKKGNPKQAIKQGNGNIGCATCSGAMTLIPPDPQGDASLWMQSLLQSQGGILWNLLGSGNAASMEAKEAEVCPDRRIYCQAAFRHQVIRAMLE